MELNEISSSDSLRAVSIKRRNCLYFEEKVLDFFPVYTKNLCRINCRIRAALQLCGCVPFFYNLSKHFPIKHWNLKFFNWILSIIDSTEPICKSAGLYCLSKSNWYSQECNCYPLCDNIYFVVTFSEKVVSLIILIILIFWCRTFLSVLFVFFKIYGNYC